MVQANMFQTGVAELGSNQAVLPCSWQKDFTWFESLLLLGLSPLADLFPVKRRSTKGVHLTEDFNAKYEKAWTEAVWNFSGKAEKKETKRSETAKSKWNKFVSAYTPEQLVSMAQEMEARSEALKARLSAH